MSLKSLFLLSVSAVKRKKRTHGHRSERLLLQSEVWSRLPSDFLWRQQIVCKLMNLIFRSCRVANLTTRIFTLIKYYSYSHMFFLAKSHPSYFQSRWFHDFLFRHILCWVQLQCIRGSVIGLVRECELALCFTVKGILWSQLMQEQLLGITVLTTHHICSCIRKGRASLIKTRSVPWL